MSIQLDGTVLSTTMRTPGNDYELAVGFCHTEGLLGDVPVRAVRYCATGAAGDTGFNMVTVETGGLAPTRRRGPGLRRRAVDGAARPDRRHSELSRRWRRSRSAPEIRWSSDPAGVAESQDLFGATGAVHAAAAFDRDGTVLVSREDVGRHNAVDKVVGRLLLDGDLPATGSGCSSAGEPASRWCRRRGPLGSAGRRSQRSDRARRSHTAPGRHRARRVRGRRPLECVRPRTPDDLTKRSARPAGSPWCTCSASRPPSHEEAVDAAVKAAEADEARSCPSRSSATRPTSGSWPSATTWRTLRQFQTRCNRLASTWWTATSRFTEVSEYAKGMPEQMLQRRLYPQLPPDAKAGVLLLPDEQASATSASQLVRPALRGTVADLMQRARRDRAHVRRPDPAADHRLDRAGRLRVGRHPLRRAPRRPERRRLHDALRPGPRRSTPTSDRSTWAT